MATSNNFVPFHAIDREWDARFNVQTDDDLQLLLAAVKEQDAQGKFRYVLVSGVEIGTRPFQPDYLIRHVHVAMVFMNRVTKSAILKNLAIKQGNGYYLVPRKKELPYSGWRAHHVKKESKVSSDSLVLYENGTIPQDRTSTGALVQKRSEEEKKRKLDDIIIEMKGMIEEGREKEAFAKFPRNYLTYGEKLKAMVIQKRDFFQQKGNPHIWLMGKAGEGKSAILQVVYPKYFNKNVDNKFFDLYHADYHTHVLLQDVDHGVMERLGMQFFKAICDEAGYPIDQKHVKPQMMRSTILVTSNFTIEDVVPDDLPGRTESLTALRRRFWQININKLLPILGLRLLDSYEIKQLKKEGNTDPRKLFLGWDYLRDCPTGEPVKEAEYYQEVIRAHFYG